jgi:demethylmenaquinone methyltransferase/2-methoxy-6-polyprenyl-1,4-benzoquinol methylase
MTTSDLYNPQYVKALFDEMSQSYGLVNYVSSFGFSERWRRQCAAQITLHEGMVAYDLMAGMGEGWPFILRGIGTQGLLVAVEFSHQMYLHAEKHAQKFVGCHIQLREENVLENSLPDASADCVLSFFGLKTFSDAQKAQLARAIQRILKPNGQFSLIEVSVPANWLKLPYWFYLKYCIPIIGKIFLGNPDNYRMLGLYTERFGNCVTMRQLLAEVGLVVEYKEYFGGCATGVSGRKR